MLIAAFDPGLNGSAALLQAGEGVGSNSYTSFVDMVDLATIDDDSNRQIDVQWLCKLLERWQPDQAVVENVQPAVHGASPDGVRRSVMSASGAFRFGMTCGMIRGALISYEIPLTLVHPQSWKRHFGLKGSDKKTGVELLKRLRPEVEQWITLVKHHGRADAGLMALWYHEKHGII